ncbi:hypothetical protein HZC33_01870 [Candidatus Wolfebacteria bacterium]|nr:hypothetical protein [Candidatus Wolfebacteria bacterium]
MPILKKPKTLFWTNHANGKMNFYKLSPQRVLRVLNSPKRIEEGIAPNTIAMCQLAGSVKHPYEIWVMIAETKIRRKIISAWKYPGITKAGEPLPKEILNELSKFLK